MPPVRKRSRQPVRSPRTASPAADKVPQAQLLFRTRTAHHDIYVRQRGSVRYLSFEPGVQAPCQAKIDLNTPATLEGDFEYAQALASAVALHPEPTRVLCLGVGGGAVPQALRCVFPGATVDAVDIDKTVLDVAHEWFGLRDDDRLRLHACDARSFLRRAGAQGLRWDVVLHDAFDRHYTPAHLMTVEFYRELSAVLGEGGFVAVNAFAQGELRDRETATFGEVFADYFQIGVVASRIVVAFPSPRPSAEVMWATLLRHDSALARAGLDVQDLALRMRSADALAADVRPLIDDDRDCPELARLRREATGRALTSAHAGPSVSPPGWKPR